MYPVGPPQPQHSLPTLVFLVSVYVRQKRSLNSQADAGSVRGPTDQAGRLGQRTRRRTSSDCWPMLPDKTNIMHGASGGTARSYEAQEVTTRCHEQI